MIVLVYKSSDKTAPINWLPNANANSLTIQNEFVFTCAFGTLLRGDFSSHKICMGEDQNSLTYHGQTGDSVSLYGFFIRSIIMIWNICSNIIINNILYMFLTNILKLCLLIIIQKNSTHKANRFAIIRNMKNIVSIIFIS